MLLTVLAVASAQATPSESGVAAAEVGLGTLLFSPAQRLAIERARVSDADVPVADAPPQTASVAGWVQRSRGKGTVWINGEPLPEGQAGFLRQPPVISARAVQVQGKALRVGETLDLATGQHMDAVSKEAVSVRSPRSPQISRNAPDIHPER